MTVTTLTLRPSRAAIAAVLALASTAAFAQDAAPAVTGPIVLPDTSATTASVSEPIATPAPTIVIPEAPTVTDEDPAQAERREVAPNPVSRTASTDRRAGSDATPAVAARSIPRDTPVSGDAAPTIASSSAIDLAAQAEPSTAEMEAAAPLAAQTPVESQREDVTEALAQVLAGLLVAGFAVGGLVMLLRRRRRTEGDAVAPIERSIVRDPLSAREVRREPAIPPAPAAIRGSENAAPVMPQGGAFALPRTAPEDPIARGELLKRMIAAPPDRANPFRSPKARLRRARLILQSLGRRFEDATPRIDLSQYPANWPALARRGGPATA